MANSGAPFLAKTGAASEKSGDPNEPVFVLFIMVLTKNQILAALAFSATTDPQK